MITYFEVKLWLQKSSKLTLSDLPSTDETALGTCDT